MTEEINELQEVKEIAANMGIKVGNIKDVTKIREMITEKKAKVEPTGPVTKADKRKAMRAEHLQLVRVRITPMSPFNRQLKGETFGFRNKYIGSVKRNIPFEVEWHVEKCLLKQIKNKVYRKRLEKVNPATGRTSYTNVFVPAYGVVELDPLSPKEIESLAASQAARQAID